jgi:tetratricopeptide (TPR) repeat protein
LISQSERGPQTPMQDLAQVLDQAADLHRKGNLAAAESLYLQLLAARSDHLDALHLLGILRYQQGRLDEALALIGAALQKNPGFAPALLNQGLVLAALSRREEALASYDQALAIQPGYVEALYNRGVVLGGMKRLDEALASFDQVLAIGPDHIQALNNRGVALRGLQRLEEALAAFDGALAARPDYVDALANRASTLRTLHRHHEALTSYDAVLRIQPRNADALSRRGLVLLELQRPAEALASYDKALALRPDHAEALNNRANTLHVLNRAVEALAGYDQALAIRPDHAEALYNRGVVLQELRRPAEALASFERTLAVKPDHVDALNNRGIVLRDLERHGEALASYDRALAIEPDNAETHVNRSCLRLLLGDLDRGFEEFEWRWRVQETAPWRRNFVEPLWLGKAPLAGRTILLHAEQGLGDAVQFVRYAPLVAAAGAEVVLEVPPPLTALLSQIEGVSRVIGRGEQLPAFDCHCPLLSLPLAFKTALATIPARVPYLFAPEDRTIKWRRRLPPSSKRRVGIAWAGNQMFKGDQTRSPGLARLCPLLSVAEVEFLSLQKDLRAGDRELLGSNPRVMHMGDAVEDFGDTAALMACVDLVITSDTSVAHLAGALGRPVWVLLQHVPDWRWLLGRDDSPWYPTARLFRQPEPGDWDSVIRQVLTMLSAS